MKYQNYIFDLYGTLLDNRTDEEAPQFWKRFAEFYAVYGADYSPMELKETYRRFDLEGRRKLSIELDTPYPEIRLEEVFLRLLEEAPKKHATAYRITDMETWMNCAANVFRLFSRSRLAVFPDTIKTLRELHDNRKNAYLLSNAQRIFTMPEIEETGLTPLLDDICISSDFGMMKPDPRFLLSLMEKHGMNPEETAMVGNDFKDDMGIAAAVGIDGIFLNSAAYDETELSRRNTTGARVISRLSELVLI